MGRPRVVAVAPSGPAAGAGLAVGDELVSLNGVAPRDVLEYRRLLDEPFVEIDVDRGGLLFSVEVDKAAGAPLGIEVDSAVFDQVRTCDNHCEFCFIYQLPAGMRSSLYLKDDDYRLSFLYGNFTTLTRFTEADFERVVTEGLSPLFVSIHATDPQLRAEMLRNRRGATSLRWLRALLDAGVAVYGQVVVCPGVNDGLWLEDTLCGVLESYSGLRGLCVVPLGVSRHAPAGRLRPHTRAEAEATLDAVGEWQAVFQRVLGRRMVFAADEYYLLAGRELPPAAEYEGFDMHEDGVGIARNFVEEFEGRSTEPTGVQAGFFSWVDGAPAAGYRAPHVGCGTGHPAPAGAGAATSTAGGGAVPAGPARVTLRRRDATVVLTGELGAAILEPMLAEAGYGEVRVVTVGNRFFGGNIGVTGLMVGEDVARVLSGLPPDGRYLLPDVCLSSGRFLDGLTTAELPRPVEVVRTDGIALRRALDAC
jgi:putative radical SAM enzyme (TIGR03279 family)